MRSYADFARYYDALMRDAGYPRRAEYLARIFAHHNEGRQNEPKTSLVLDLACGTGSMTLELLKLGFDVIGVDRSEEMLAEARRKLEVSGRQALLLCQDMCALDLYGTVDAAVCCMDSVNHLTDIGRVRAAFERVSLFLNPGGLFVFDVNTPYKFRSVLADNAFVYDCESVFCAWQNDFRPKSGLCRFALTFFEERDGAWLRSDESFSEKSYSDRSLRRALREAGLVPEAVYAELSFDPPGPVCQRAFYVARKPAGVPAEK